MPRLALRQYSSRLAHRTTYRHADVDTSTDDDEISSTDDDGELSSGDDMLSSTDDEDSTADEYDTYSSASEDSYTTAASMQANINQNDQYIQVPIRARDTTARRVSFVERTPSPTPPTQTHTKAQSKDQPLPPYRYHYFKDPEGQMRILTVHSFKGYPVQCSLQTHTRSKASEQGYRALSYHWGSPNPKSTIHIHGRKFYVQKNLYEFLEHAARMKAKGIGGWTTGKYWIDALCIDQKDSEEKSVQLKHIRKTYRQASETIMWLGPGGPGITDAMKYIKKQCKAQQKSLEDDSFTEYLADSRDLLLYSPDLVKAVNVILSSPYWSRVWILQEIAVADRERVTDSEMKEKIRMVCGGGEVPWSYFMQFAMIIPLLKFGSQDLATLKLQKKVQKKQAVWLLTYLYGRKSSAIPGLKVISMKTPRLGLLVYLSEHSFSSQGQDYIYALLGLIVAGKGQDIEPQVNRSGCSVICLAIRRILEDVKNTEFNEDSFPYVAKLKELAAEARHKPLDRSLSMEERRKKCSGRHCESSGCDCKGHCNALDVCRKMARMRYGHKVLLTVRYGGKMFKIGRDKIVRRSYTPSGALRDTYDAWRVSA
jgi:hypothetical protein